MMQAYFSGKLPTKRIRCHITYGEEGEDELGIDFKGAREILRTLNKNDVVIVIDVTGIPSRSFDLIQKENFENIS